MNAPRLILGLQAAEDISNECRCADGLFGQGLATEPREAQEVVHELLSLPSRPADVVDELTNLRRELIRMILDENVREPDDGPQRRSKIGITRSRPVEKRLHMPCGF